MTRRPMIAITIMFIFMVSILVFNGTGMAASVTEQAKKLRFIGASPGGTYFIVLGGISEAVNKSIPKWSTTVEPGTALSDILRIVKGDGDLTLTQNNVVIDTINKEGAEYKKLCSLGAIATSGAQLIALKNTGITTFDQFINEKPKLKISFGPPSEVHYLAAQRLLGEYDLTMDDLKKWGCKIFYKEMGDATDMVSSGVLQAYFLIALTPTAPTTELSFNKELTFVAVKDDIIQKLAEKYNYVKVTLPEGTYNFIEKPVNVFAAKTIMAVSYDMPDEIAYNIVKSMIENNDYLKNLHAILKNLTFDYMVDTGGVPLHPGAIKAYKEAGIIK